MTKFVSAALAVLAMGLAGSMPAAAAKWDCTGPAHACTDLVTSKSITSTKAAYKVSKTSYRQASFKSKSSKGKYVSRTLKSHKVASTASYLGGGSRGMASYYWQPQALASGGRFNPDALTAAHITLPFGTRVLVTNLNNGRSVVVTINDRGPYVAGRVIDLSRRAAQVVGMTGSGVAPVSYSIVGRG